jgi:hypothetical protein
VHGLREYRCVGFNIKIAAPARQEKAGESVPYTAPKTLPCNRQPTTTYQVLGISPKKGQIPTLRLVRFATRLN